MLVLNIYNRAFVPKINNAQIKNLSCLYGDIQTYFVITVFWEGATNKGVGLLALRPGYGLAVNLKTYLIGGSPITNGCGSSLCRKQIAQSTDNGTLTGTRTTDNDIKLPQLQLNVLQYLVILNF